MKFYENDINASYDDGCGEDCDYDGTCMCDYDTNEEEDDTW